MTVVTLCQRRTRGEHYLRDMARQGTPPVVRSHFDDSMVTGLSGPNPGVAGPLLVGPVIAAPSYGQ